MGVQNLWLLLSPAAQKLPESQLASKRLAIDISIWVLHILHGYLSLGSSNYENIHLLGVFKRLLRLLSLGVKPVFVFDGKAPELKHKTVAERAHSRKINIKKLAEKIIVKQLEGKTLKLKENQEDSDGSQMDYEENIDEPKDLLRTFEEEVELEMIKELLKENDMSFEEYQRLDYVHQKQCIKRLRQEALEKKHEKLAAIDNNKDFSKAQLNDYLSLVQKKKEIEERKKEVANNVNQQIISENLNRIGFENNKDFEKITNKGKIEVSKNFVVIKNNLDPEIEKMRNLIGKIQKPVRKTKKQKVLECSEKLSKLLEGKDDSNDHDMLNQKKFLQDALAGGFNLSTTGLEAGEKDNIKDPMKSELGVSFMDLNTGLELKKNSQNLRVNTTLEKGGELKILSSDTKEQPTDITKDNVLLEKMIGSDEKFKDFNERLKEFFVGNGNSKVHARVAPINEKSMEKSNEEFMVPLSKKKQFPDKEQDITIVNKIESLRKDFHQEETRRMLSTHNSRSSSQSSLHNEQTLYKDSSNFLSNPLLHQATTPMKKSPKSSNITNPSPLKLQLSQEEILQELEKMDSLEPQEDDPELESDFLRLSNLNSLNESLSSKFDQIKLLLQLFGVPWVESPFEAEAQCAYLELNGLIDGIITEDSDVFLFGGSQIYRKVFAGSNSVDFYDMKRIEKDLGLNREKLISLALFLGSDYTLGVKGIGIVNAMEIVNAFETIESLERFKLWAEKADILLEDSETYYRNISLKELDYKHFHKNYKKNWEFPLEFPDYQVVEGYMKPTVDESKEMFKWNEPNIEGLKEFCKEVFGWDQQRMDDVGFELGKIVKKMRESNGQRKIDEFFRVEKVVGIVKSRRLQAAIKGMKEEEKNEEEVDEEIQELEQLNMFNYKRKKN